MSHIEFMGVSGSGKSTAHDKLTSKKFFYGGIHENAILRLVFGKNHWLTDTVRIPDPIYTRVWRILRPHYFDQYSRSHGDLALNILLKNVDEEGKKMRRLFKDVGASYSLGIDTQREDEILVLDEGFYQRAASAYYRMDKGSIDIVEYISQAPEPTHLIYVSPNNKTINKRKYRRDGEYHSNKKLEKENEFFDKMADLAQKRGTNVIQIDSASEIENLNMGIEGCGSTSASL